MQQKTNHVILNQFSISTHSHTTRQACDKCDMCWVLDVVFGRAHAVYAQCASRCRHSRVIIYLYILLHHVPVDTQAALFIKPSACTEEYMLMLSCVLPQSLSLSLPYVRKPLKIDLGELGCLSLLLLITCTVPQTLTLSHTHK